MREVLSDYYAVEMYSLDSHAAVKKLIDIFRDDSVTLLPLAHYVEQCLENVKRIVLLGSTGDGKSSLANALLGLKSNEVFKESSMTESCTVTTTEQNGAWLGTGSLCTIIDTPGMNDSQGRDLDQVDHILETLKKDRWVNTFLVVRKGDNLRMDGPFKSMLKMFEMIFGVSFWRHIVMSISKTRYIEEETESVKESIVDWEDAIKEKFQKARTTSLPSVVLDTGKQNNPNFEKEAGNLWEICSSTPSFECKDFEETNKLLIQQKEKEKETACLLLDMRWELQKKEEELSRIRGQPIQNKRKHSGEENALKKRLTCSINARLPAIEEDKKTVLCEIEYFQKNLPESDIDLKFLEQITNFLTANAKKLEWETITFRAEDLRPGSTILHYSFTYERQVSDQEEQEGRDEMERILNSAMNNLESFLRFVEPNRGSRLKDGGY